MNATIKLDIANHVNKCPRKCVLYTNIISDYLTHKKDIFLLLPPPSQFFKQIELSKSKMFE